MGPGITERVMLDSGARLLWQVSAWESGAGVECRAVWRDTSGNRARTKASYTTSSVGINTAGTLSVGPGVLERVIVRATDSGITQRGVWTRVSVGPFDAGVALPELVLLEGVIGASGMISWPMSGPRDAAPDGSFPFVVSVSAPAAGAQWSYTPSGWEMVQLQTVAAKFVASATVATRIPIVTLFSGANRVCRSPIGNGITANATKLCSWSIRTGAAISNGSQLAGPLVFESVLAGYTVQSEVESVQAGDQWSDIYLIGRGRLNV